ncbi:hypothetical protein ElyMa_001552100 [Elysia marginata]|uniref:WAP domain-containing protein n=1 Tax=Elysia marginata TaxID=1093978 RepID=A0AAV4JE87_9GAST|nr:hypothetical protein ElyMa_001552100 [Elysia marginata]
MSETRKELPGCIHPLDENEEANEEYAEQGDRDFFPRLLPSSQPYICSSGPGSSVDPPRNGKPCPKPLKKDFCKAPNKSPRNRPEMDGGPDDLCEVPARFDDPCDTQKCCPSELPKDPCCSTPSVQDPCCPTEPRKDVCPSSNDLRHNIDRRPIYRWKNQKCGIQRGPVNFCTEVTHSPRA